MPMAKRKPEAKATKTKPRLPPPPGTVFVVVQRLLTEVDVTVAELTREKAEWWAHGDRESVHEYRLVTKADKAKKARKR
jgi:hypothetical protein